MDDSRPIVRVTDFDHVAAIQILACIARPHDGRTASAGDLMQQWYWARQRSKRQPMPPELEITIPKKDKIVRQLPKLAKDFRNAFDAGDWLKSQLRAESKKAEGWQVHASSLRALAARRINRDKAEEFGSSDGWIKGSDDETRPMFKKVWIKRRAVVHMALAVREELRVLYPDEFLSDFEAMEQVVFQPSWVRNALDRAEEYAEAAIRHKIIDPKEPWRFIR
jgi:hypothetical protein